jgi:hypothetical protein
VTGIPQPQPRVTAPYYSQHVTFLGSLREAITHMLVNPTVPLWKGDNVRGRYRTRPNRSWLGSLRTHRKERRTWYRLMSQVGGKPGPVRPDNAFIYS